MKGLLIKALPIVARALSENYGVSLEIHGNQARTDGKSIVLPVLPEDDRKAAILARGYLDHEAGHVKHTDFSIPKGSGLAGTLANILEDIRVEQAMSRRYPGCRVNLDALVRLLVAEGDFTPVQPTDPPARIVQGLVLYLLRSRVLGQRAMAPLAAQAQAVFDDKFPGLRSRVEAMALQVHKAEDTKEVIGLAKRIAGLFKEAAPPQAPASDPQSSGGPGPSRTGESCPDTTGPHQQQPGQDDGADDDQSDLDDEDDDDGSDEPAYQDGGGQPSRPDSPQEPDAGESGQAGDGLDGNSPSGQPTGQDGGSSGRSQDQPEAQPGGQGSSAPGCDTDGAGQSGGLAAAAAAALADDAGYLDLGQTVARKLEEISQEKGGTAMAVEEQPWWSGQPLNDQEMMQATARLRAMLAGVVQARRARKERPSRWGTRLNLRGLPHLAANGGRVFLSPQERSGVNTAVYLLLDQSGSMVGRIKVAFMATVALARSLKAIPGTAVAVGSFTSMADQPVVFPLLGFGDSDRRMNLMVPPPSGSTPLAEAMYCVAAKLLRRPEPRKLLVVMTDGEPDDKLQTLEVIKKCRGAGIEVYGIGIMLSFAETLFGPDRAIVVHKIGELPGKLFKLLAQRL